MKLTTPLAVSTSLFFVLASVALTGWSAKAQVLYGSIVGAVQDVSGSAVPGAMVTITNDSTGQSHQASTTNDGLYSFIDVLPGPYTVTITAKGFRTSRTTNTQVSINTVTCVDAQMQVGERAETVTVEASAAAIQTDSADVHVSLKSREITQLPLPGYRNYQTLINLVPGATPAAYQNAVSGSPARSLNTNINGTTT